MSEQQQDLALKVVYVSNLGYGCNATELWSKFYKVGPLRDVWISQNPPGFAYVEFKESMDALHAAHSLNGVEINGNRASMRISSRRTAQPSARCGDEGTDYTTHYGHTRDGYWDRDLNHSDGRGSSSIGRRRQSMRGNKDKQSRRDNSLQLQGDETTFTDIDPPQGSVGGERKVLYVGNLNYKTNRDSIMKAFKGACGAKIPIHYDGVNAGKSKGFAFVEFRSPETASKALHAMNGAVLDGRKLKVYFSEQCHDKGSAATAVPEGYWKFPERTEPEKQENLSCFVNLSPLSGLEDVQEKRQDTINEKKPIIDRKEPKVLISYSKYLKRKNKDLKKGSTSQEEVSCKKKVRRDLVLKLHRIDALGNVKIEDQLNNTTKTNPHTSIKTKNKVETNLQRRSGCAKGKENIESDDVDYKKGNIQSDDVDYEKENIEIDDEIENISYDTFIKNMANVEKAESLEDKIFRCNICDNSMSSIESIVRHVKSHEIYKCKTCRKMFADRRSLKFHEKTKTHIDKLKRIMKSCKV